jgi:hypothetical protein
MQAFAANAAKNWLTATDGITVTAADRTIRAVPPLVVRVEYAPDMLREVGLVAFRVSAVGSPP